MQTMSGKSPFSPFFLIVALWAAASGYGAQPATRPTQVVKTTINGLEFVLDKETGSILRLSHPGVGMILDATPDAASVLDLAYPVKEFEPLRLASRFSHGAKIAKIGDRLSIHWDQLGASRSFVDVPGRVAATVTLTAAADGRSVIMTCQIENHSNHAIPQVLFPDFLGLVAFAGVPETEFRSGKQIMRPFVALAKPVSDVFYARNETFAQVGSNGKDDSMDGRWMNLGGPSGGFSLFPKEAVGHRMLLYLHLWEKNHKLRLMYSYEAGVAAGGAWKSYEYWLTPHQGGWQEGIEPYQASLKQQTNRNTQR
jgi:hypothetical protein